MSNQSISKLKMENTHCVGNTFRASKILIDRDRLWKNTIYVNPRILKTSGALMHHKMDIASVPLGYTGNCSSSDASKHNKCYNIQSVQQKVTQSSEGSGSFPAARKCVYLNPHFQRTASTSVHINPKKFSHVVERSNHLLVNTQPDRTKQESKVTEISKSNLSVSGEKSLVSNTHNTNSSSHSSTYPIGSNNHCTLAAQNKKWNRCGADKIQSSKQVENCSLMKKISHNKLVRVSDTKLVRIPDKTKSWCVNRALQKALIHKQYQTLKKNPEIKDGRTIKKKSEKQKKSSYSQMHFPVNSPPASNRPEKYNLSQKLLPTVVRKGKPDLPTSPSCGASKYKIDRRLAKSRLLRNYKKVSCRYENGGNKFQRKNISPKGCVFPVLYRGRNSSTMNSKFNDGKKIVISSRKLLRIGSTMKSKESARKKGESSDSTRLIRIGGVLYKTSRTRLTRSRTQITSAKQLVVKRHKTDKSRTIYIRGNKFIMDAKGKTLRQVPQNTNNNCPKDGKPLPLKRVYIGGVTFVQKSSSLLVRTNTHTARSIVNHAKNKSIAMLTNKLRKINQPCAFYRRFGKCPRKDKGMCQLVHDPKQIAVCKRFLQGECSIDNCPLSHQIVPEKMPTCKYFLERCCTRENCPYLHVKLNSKAVICESFLQGYCAEGSKCKKRHSYVCPEYEKHGTCKKGKYCPYPHNAGSKLNKKTVSNQAKQVKAEHTPGDPARKRYYQEEKTENKDSSVTEEENFKKSEISPHKEAEDSHRDLKGSGPDKDEPVLKRPRIGRLPSFIALSH
ncbi:uncharacterized protein LOC126480833 [Schistocerca serialis cubense]|uniref:uncharacterized protein LOC126480833 n=1 Tax=Schistocerca serialis cubense TaxID=2023355 RepID=UPI00214E3FAC|nr:uncharacterized protein LOC126480833 [Schistocerca serialis cubense]